MRIDMVVEPVDLFTTPQVDVDLEASGQTFAVELSRAVGREFPEARLNIWYSPTAVRSEERLEVHWADGEIDPASKADERARITDRVEAIASTLREDGDWVVRVA